LTAPRSILVAGAGLAGARCAETLRAEGYEGELVLVGEEPTPPYERPALSKEFLAGRRSAADLLLRPSSFWAEQGIELLLGQRVVCIDAERRTATTGAGNELVWDALVIATGARPRRLPFMAPTGVHVLRNLADAVGLRAELFPGVRLVVVGGGFVGAEVASTARSLGAEVTLLEAGTAPFATRLGSELAAVLERRYRAHGVDVRTRTRAAGFRADAAGRIRAVELSDGTEIECEVALIAIGVEPERELLRREPAPPVYACGDTAGSGGHWVSAAAQAVDVARLMLGLDPLPLRPPFFWSDQFGLRLQLVGDTTHAETIELEGSEEGFVARYRRADGRVAAALAANRPAEVGTLTREVALAA
jgi:3-phenylpropionate/trans-cinnamate dioxygenase ferredoxin reductase subunit